MQLSGLHAYPVKSLGGVAVDELQIEPWGPRHDRRYMIVDAEGENVTAREERTLLQVTAEPLPEAGIRLSAAGREPLVVDAPLNGPYLPVGLSRLDRARCCAGAADGWLSDFLGRQVRLVWQDDPTSRPIGAHHGGLATETMSLADAGPLLVTSTASLARLNGWIADTRADLGEPATAPLDMQRFRPNIVVTTEDGSAAAPVAFAEDGWTRVRIGELTLRLSEPCDRCVMTTVDPATARSGKEPIRTLARHRRHDGAVFFGVRMIPEGRGTVRVGDRLTLV